MLLKIKEQIFLGTFIKDGDFLEFFMEKTNKEIIALGDIVYFFIANDEVLKVGKAGGKSGFYGRINQYKRGHNADNTNRRITKLMHEHNIDIVQIFCIQAPRIKTQYVDAFTGLLIDIEAPTNVGLEQFYLSELFKEHRLLFCYQLS